MKKLMTVLLISSISISASAQDIQSQLTENKAPKVKKYELGVTTEMNVFGDNNASFQALQFKKWKNEHYGARLLLGYGNFQSNNDFPIYYTEFNDTITKSAPYRTSQIGFAGLGLEAQRQFYKRVYLFAAVEAKFGYGTTMLDTLVERVQSNANTRPWENNPGSPQIRTGTGVSKMFYVGVTPTFGAKFQFSHITFGSEMAWNVFNYTSYEHPAGHSNTTDFDMSKISPRFFVHYRF